LIEKFQHAGYKGAAHRNINRKASSCQTSGFSDEIGNLIIKEKP
jgi:hypothetical protein